MSYARAFNKRARAAGTRPLEPLEMLVLQTMALSARDKDPQPTYFAGRDTTLEAIGLDTSAPSRRRLMRATSALIEAGAITRAKSGHRGSTAVYSLKREGVPLVVPIVDNSAERVSPEVPNNGNGYHESPEWVPRESRMGTTRGTPKEGRGLEEEGDARASTFELEQPPTPTPHPWDHDLPEPRTAREAARCPKHPHGTPDRCVACGDNRTTWTEAHPDAPTRPRKPRPYDCDAGRHRVTGEKRPGVPDDICVTCHQRGVIDALAPANLGATA